MKDIHGGLPQSEDNLPVMLMISSIKTFEIYISDTRGGLS